ncbi:Disease resistance protein [Melia azedarach]|uniref:Disease resistance protein n=1 Tax=Melia azedarach TaxID=155640 RepID=A0ACC1Y450_MELAZ|nr:Disease resistance protein [Melia azedarach]
MAEALVSVVLDQLASILVEQVKAKVKLVVGVEEEVKKLTSNFRAIKSVLEDAENRQVKENAVRDWLDKLKDASYDIEDVLDEWKTEVQKLQMKEVENASQFKKKVRSLVLRNDIADKIKNLNKMLDDIAKEKDMFGFSLTGTIKKLEPQKTTSFIDISKVHGRHQDKHKIIELLLSERNEGVESLPVISLVGMGGIGKTTLARLAYHDNRLNTHFHKKIWVCVSDPFDEVRIARAILESLQGAATNLAELDAILQHISQTIRTKRFFLVLDDVWTEDANKWEQLRDCLQSGYQGSRILLTTRKENVAQIMGTTHMISVGKLPEKECWSLFSQVALAKRTKEQCDKLEDIGRRIVRNCNGLPLTIKTLGSLLSLKTNVEQWQSILDSELWKLEEIEKGLFPPLLLSYYDLPSNLRKCFSYCSIFPKDYKIEKDKLIKLWMAQGYLRVKGREDIELIGEAYFENLAKRSFFQDFETKDEDGSIISFKMHDIVRDFAQYLSENECLSIEVDSPTVSDQLEFASQKVRHSMIILKENGSFPICLSTKARLRTLLVECEDRVLTKCEDKVLASNILSQLFYKYRCIRAIDLGNLSDYLNQPINDIPRGIGKLIHLRYLALKKDFEIEQLPEELCDLYNLQTLDISCLRKLRKLPEGIGKLINLRHLINFQTPLKYLPKGFERLTNLRTLNEFPVSGSDHGSKACTLECLKSFRYLRGSLMIRRLRSVTGIAEIENADLKGNRNLLHLELEFFSHQGKERPDTDVYILQALQLPSNLETLKITSYKSRTMGNHWMVSLTNLKVLEMSFCSDLQRLPSLGSLPSLESLKISYVDCPRKVGQEFLGESSVVAFPKLKSLLFYTIYEWKRWDYKFSGGEEIVIMPCLRSLKFYRCPELEALPDHILRSTTLEELEIRECPKLEKHCCVFALWMKLKKQSDKFNPPQLQGSS